MRQAWKDNEQFKRVNSSHRIRQVTHEPREIVLPQSPDAMSSQRVVELLKTRSLLHGYADGWKISSLSFGAATFAFGVIYPDLPIEARLYTLGVGGILTGLTGTAWRTFNRIGNNYSQKAERILEKHHLVPVKIASEHAPPPVVSIENLNSQVDQAAAALRNPNVPLEVKVEQRSLLTALRDRLTSALEGWRPSQGEATRPQGKPVITEALSRAIEQPKKD